jgi:hypothetical protein
VKSSQKKKKKKKKWKTQLLDNRTGGPSILSYADEMKAAGFGLGRRKLFGALCIGAMDELCATLQHLLGEGWSVKVDWKSLKDEGVEDEKTFEKLLKSLGEVLFPGIREDFNTMGTEELAAFAHDTTQKCLEFEYGQRAKCELDKKKGRFVITFSQEDVVVYPNHRLDVRDCIMSTCEGAPNPSKILPASSLNRETKSFDKTKVVFKQPAPEMEARKGWIATECPSDHRGQGNTKIWIKIASIESVREVIVQEERGYFSEVFMQNGNRFVIPQLHSDLMNTIFAVKSK